jgi:hypothetical protein
LRPDRDRGFAAQGAAAVGEGHQYPVDAGQVGAGALPAIKAPNLGVALAAMLVVTVAARARVLRSR